MRCARLCTLRMDVRAMSDPCACGDGTWCSCGYYGEYPPLAAVEGLSLYCALSDHALCPGGGDTCTCGCHR
jgi:hypothetical protein